MKSSILEALKQLQLPKENSHKGQNGKLLIIGGSELFHAASKWSLDVASHFVDMVFYASVPSNNELIREAKGEFWNGIVVARQDIPDYMEEVDCILIGPGMTRDEGMVGSQDNLAKWPLSEEEWNSNTKTVVDSLLQRYPNKKWVIDAGALQMVAPQLLNQNCLITPHLKELENLVDKIPGIETSMFVDYEREDSSIFLKELQGLSSLLNGATILLKGHVDFVANSHRTEVIEGGGAGMTKGGTGDVLAGLAGGLYATNDLWTTAVVASFTNKKAGEYLAERKGPFFNASELVEVIPEVVWGLVT